MTCRGSPCTASSGTRTNRSSTGSLYQGLSSFLRSQYSRFLPKESPPQLWFPVSGTEVELSMSDMKVVHLTNISLASAGQYQCEVRKDISSLLTSLTSHQGQHRGSKIQNNCPRLCYECSSSSCRESSYHLGQQEGQLEGQAGGALGDQGGGETSSSL